MAIKKKSFCINDTLLIHNDATSSFLKFDQEGNFLKNIKASIGVMNSPFKNPIVIDKNMIFARASNISFSDSYKKATYKAYIVKLNSKLKLVRKFDNINYKETIPIKTPDYVVFDSPFDQIFFIQLREIKFLSHIFMIKNMR